MGERNEGVGIPHLEATNNAVIDQCKRIGLPGSDIGRALGKRRREVCANTSITGSRRTLGIAIAGWVARGRRVIHAGDKPG
jgi:hypothetical protein